MTRAALRTHGGRGTAQARGCTAEAPGAAPHSQTDRGAGQTCIKKGGGGEGGVWLGTPPPVLRGSPCGPPSKGGREFRSVNPLGTEGAEAKVWLSASNIGRGRGGGLGGGGGSLSSCGVWPV